MLPPPSSTTDDRDGRLWLLAYAGIASLVIMFFYPGRVVPDTIDMCGQAVTGVYTDWHSPILAGLWGFLGVDVSTIFVVQTLAIVFAARSLLGAYLRPVVAAIATLVIVLNPATLGWLGHVGKDEWFCALVLWTVASLAAAARSEDTNRRRILIVVALVLAWFAIASRGNAAAGVLGACLPFAGLLTPARLSNFRPVANRLASWAWVAGVVVMLAISAQLYARIVIQPERHYVEQATMTFDLAGMSERTGQLLMPDLFLDPGATLADVEANFDEGAAESWFFSQESPLRYPVRDGSEIAELRSVWLSAIRAHPIAYLQLRLSYALDQLGVTQPHPGGSVDDQGSQPESFGIVCDLPHVAIPPVNSAVDRVLWRTDESNLVRGWVFLVLLIVSSVVAWRPRCNEARALLGAAILNEMTIALLGISATYRYSWFLVVAAQLAAALALRRSRRLARRFPEAELDNTEESPDVDDADTADTTV
jgi:hypothetical protein